MPVNRSKPFVTPMPPLPQPRSLHPGDPTHDTPCASLIRLTEKVASLESWRTTTEVDLRDIREVISQVRLLMNLSVGGGGLSLLALLAFIVDLLVR